MKRNQRRYVRQMPKIYGNLQKPPRDFSAFWAFLRSLFWLSLIGLIVYVIWFSDYFKIEKVEVEGTRFVSADNIKKMVPYGSNILFFSSEDLSNKILQDQALESVGVFRGLPSSLKIVIKERQPALIWNSGDYATILDDQGAAFAQYSRAGLPTEDTEMGKYLKQVPRLYDTKAVPVSLGSKVTNKDFVSFIQNVQERMASLLPQVTIDHYEISDTTYDLTMIAKQGLQVQLNSLGEAGPQIRNLTRLIHQGKATLTSKVDLRVDRWAYVQ